MENTSPQQIEGSGIDPWSGSNHGLNHELSWHESLLSGDSRTLALTIPQLPSGLREAGTNASLLCRIDGTIEDDPVLDPETKDGFKIFLPPGSHDRPRRR